MNPDRVEALFKVAYRATVYRHKKRWPADTCISFYEFKNIVTQDCVYCGHVGSNKWKDMHHGKELSKVVLRINGVDRQDNDSGYVTGNVASACKFCNNSKAIMPIPYFTAWVKQVHDHLQLGEK
jgi:hypothetical protein